MKDHKIQSGVLHAPLFTRTKCKRREEVVEVGRSDIRGRDSHVNTCGFIKNAYCNPHRNALTFPWGLQ